jgi:hypothetical protein
MPEILHQTCCPEYSRPDIARKSSHSRAHNDKPLIVKFRHQRDESATIKSGLFLDKLKVVESELTAKAHDLVVFS